MGALDNDLTEVIRILNLKSIDELSDICNDEARLFDLTSELEGWKELAVQKESLVENNTKLANNNLGKKPLVGNLQQSLVAKYQDLDQKRLEYGEDMTIYDSKTGTQSLDTVHALLQAKAAEVEEDSEKLSESYLDGEVGLEQFLSLYGARRAVAHRRRVKAEKMGELMNQQQSSATSESSATAQQNFYSPPVQQTQAYPNYFSPPPGPPLNYYGQQPAPAYTGPNFYQ